MCDPKFDIGNIEGDLNISESPEQKVDSIINIIIGQIVSASVHVDLLNRTFPATISNKIKHNELKSKRNIVLQYKSYSSHIEKAYEIADKNIINGKQSAFIILNGMYIDALAKYEIDPYNVDMTKIRNHADDIIGHVIKQLRKFVYKSSNHPSYKEQIEVGINVVVAHAFVECIVLENPNATS